MNTCAHGMIQGWEPCEDCAYRRGVEDAARLVLRETDGSLAIRIEYADRIRALAPPAPGAADEVTIWSCPTCRKVYPTKYASECCPCWGDPPSPSSAAPAMPLHPVNDPRRDPRFALDASCRCGKFGVGATTTTDGKVTHSRERCEPVASAAPAPAPVRITAEESRRITEEGRENRKALRDALTRRAPAPGAPCERCGGMQEIDIGSEDYAMWVSCPACKGTGRVK